MDPDLEQIRRSLAMAPQLPGKTALWLLDETQRLREQVRELEDAARPREGVSTAIPPASTP